MMNSHEQIRYIVNNRPANRIGMYEPACWPETLDRWRAEGLPPDQEPSAFLMDDVVRSKLDMDLWLETRCIEEADGFYIQRVSLEVTRCSSIAAESSPS